MSVRFRPTGPELLFALGPIEQHDGSTRATMPTGTPYVDDRGEPSVGSLGVLVDNVLGYAIIDALGDPPWSVSTEIWVDVVAPLPADGSTLRAGGRLLRADAVGSYAAGELHDAAGGLVAVCRQRGRATPTAPSLDAPDPGTTTAGASTVADLLGLQVTGDASARLVTTPALLNPNRMLHGGISFCASEALAAHERRAAGGDGLVTTSVHIVHTRGVPAGAVVELRARVVHAGRSLRVVDVTGTVGERVVTTARVTSGPRWSP